ncbi:MAG: hypothetical protein K8R69_05160 [Deltaproteobacteria bacterium]|nr:hypothetical protein [Deltaproteobacteria bacterium]
MKTGDHAWFVAFAPDEDPEIAIAVMVEHGGHGGSVAAPIAQKVMEEYFKGRSPENAKKAVTLESAKPETRKKGKRKPR